ncbi:MAG: hypothetical protein IJT00_02065, partial [Lachnospiraceae bacterium]|nr:hypothetical protein [Lachnospiraceae bacterium]
LSETYNVPFYDVLNDSYRQFSQIYAMEGVEGARTLYGRAAYDENVLQMNYLSMRGAQIVSDYVFGRLLDDFPQLNDYLSAKNESAASTEDAVIFDPGA